MFGLRVLRPRLGAKRVSAFFFFFLLLAVKADFFNREQCICALFTNPQISLFINFFIKNGSHDTIHIFKNYFVTMFFSFQFSAVSKQTLILFFNWINIRIKIKCLKINGQHVNAKLCCCCYCCCIEAVFL